MYNDTDDSNAERAYTRKRKWWERFDGYKVKSAQAMRKLAPYLLTTRVASTNYFEITYDAEEIIKYLDEKNRKLEENPNPNNPIKQYTYTQFFITLIVRILAIRPELNRFISRKNIYQRHNIEIAYMLKQEFSDEGKLQSRVDVFERDSNIEDVGYVLLDSIEKVKSTADDNTGDFVDTLVKFPNFIISFVVWIFNTLIYIGYCPAILRKIDTMQSSVMFSNVGSIGLEGAPHHHLYDRGTGTLLISVGRIRKEKYISDNGIEEKDVIDFKVSMDERVADGYYFIKTFDVLKEILDNPQQLDNRLKEVPLDE